MEPVLALSHDFDSWMVGLALLHLEDPALAKIFRRCLPALLALSCGSALAQSWIQPTAEELEDDRRPSCSGRRRRFTLIDEERADDNWEHMHSIYVRLKILTEEGREYADVGNTGFRSQPQLLDPSRRRDGPFHSDGTVIPFNRQASRQGVGRSHQDGELPGEGV